MTDSETFELTVTPMNDIPVAQNINISTTEDTPVEVPVSGSDIEGDTLTFELVDSPQHGGLGPSFVISIDAVGGGQTHFLNLGFLPFATDVYDVGIDIYAPPPPPPPGFAAALGWEGDRYFTQIVEGSADDLVEHIWDIQLQYPEDNIITLTWDNTGLSDLGTFLLQDAFDGSMINVDMTVNESLTLTNPAFNILKIRVTPAEVWAWVYTPEENYYGSDEFTYRAFDGELYSDEAMVNISIDGENDWPELGFIGNQETSEDTSLVLTLEASDVDSPELVFSASSDNESVAVSIAGDLLTMAPAPNYFGTANIMVTVNDGFLTDAETFMLTVTSVNDLPTIVLPESFTFTEDGSLVEDFAGYLDDIDGDALILTVSDNENVTVQIDDLVVTFGTLPDFNGSEAVTFTVDDSQGLSFASDDMEIIVTPVNDAPVLEEIGDQQTAENQILLLDIIATDVDGDEIFIEAESDTSAVEAKMVQGQLKITPALNWNGTAGITVTVSDGFLTDEKTFSLTVNPVNDAPVAEEVAIVPSVPLETHDLELSYNYTDIEGDPESGTEITWLEDHSQK